MRRITGGVFLSLDGVMQAPGGPSEDCTGGFDEGGWMFKIWDPGIEDTLGKMFSGDYDLLLGRRTYDIFAAYWPYAEEPENRPMRDAFDAANKYVLTRGDQPLEWRNSHRLSGIDDVATIKASEGSDIVVQGSSTIYPALLAAGLIDELVQGGGGDFMAAVGNPVPLSVISKLIGFRNADPAMLMQGATDGTTVVGATQSLEMLTPAIERSLALGEWITEQMASPELGEDTLLGWKVRRQGVATYAPDAVVAHAVFPPDIPDQLSRTWQAAAFPGLLREVPELRGAFLRHGVFLDGLRVPLYLAALCAVLRRPKVAALALAWWVASHWRAARRLEPSRKRCLKALPVLLATDALTGAALVVGSTRTRSLVL